MIGSRTAIVTGASRGIGKAVAERLARDGLAVVVGYLGRAEGADQTVKAIEGFGGRALAARADVADEGEVTNLFDAAEKKFGGVDVVVNSAGMMVLGKVAELDLSDLDRMHRTNIRGTFVVLQQAARRVRPGGAIITLSSSAERQALEGYAPYAMTKGAVEAINLILARELRGKDITVNSIGPGPTATELFMQGKSPQLLEHIAKLNPMERIGDPDDVAEVVSFLAGPCRWINAQSLYVNGGMN